MNKQKLFITSFLMLLLVLMPPLASAKSNEETYDHDYYYDYPLDQLPAGYTTIQTDDSLFVIIPRQEARTKDVFTPLLSFSPPAFKAKPLRSTFSSVPTFLNVGIGIGVAESGDPSFFPFDFDGSNNPLRKFKQDKQNREDIFKNFEKIDPQEKNPSFDEQNPHTKEKNNHDKIAQESKDDFNKARGGGKNKEHMNEAERFFDENNENIGANINFERVTWLGSIKEITESSNNDDDYIPGLNDRSYDKIPKLKKSKGGSIFDRRITQTMMNSGGGGMKVTVNNLQELMELQNGGQKDVELYISNRLILGEHPNAINIIIDLLANNRLKKMDLSHVNLDPDLKTWKTLAEVLKKNTSLQVLNISNNRIGTGKESKAFGESLGEILKENATMKKLVLRKGIELEGLKGLVKGLKKNTSLQNININYNHLGAKGVEVLREALEKNTCLKVLSIGDNNIGTKGAEILGEILEKNTYLKEMYIGDNYILPDGVKALKKGLDKNNTLQKMYLVSDDFWNRMLMQSTQNRMLMHSPQNMPKKEDFEKIERKLALNKAFSSSLKAVAKGDYEEIRTKMDQYKKLCKEEKILELPMVVKTLGVMDDILDIKKVQNLFSVSDDTIWSKTDPETGDKTKHTHELTDDKIVGILQVIKKYFLNIIKSKFPKIKELIPQITEDVHGVYRMASEKIKNKETAMAVEKAGFLPLMYLYGLSGDEKHASTLKQSVISFLSRQDDETGKVIGAVLPENILREKLFDVGVIEFCGDQIFAFHAMLTHEHETKCFMPIVRSLCVFEDSILHKIPTEKDLLKKDIEKYFDALSKTRSLEDLKKLTNDFETSSSGTPPDVMQELHNLAKECILAEEKRFKMIITGNIENIEKDMEDIDNTPLTFNAKEFVKGTDELNELKEETEKEERERHGPGFGGI